MIKQFCCVLLIIAAVVLTGCQKPPELRGFWRSQNGHWMVFTNGKNMDITMGGTFTDAQFKFNSASEIAFGFWSFGGVKWEVCNFKTINNTSFFLSDCSNDSRDGIYRYISARR